MTIRDMIVLAASVALCGYAAAQTATVTDMVVKDNLTVSNDVLLLADVAVGGSLVVTNNIDTRGTNIVQSWDRLQLSGTHETLPDYISNVVAIATGSITAVSLGALTNESDTLATVLARGNDAAGQSATNFGDMSGTGRRVWGTGQALTNIDATAAGAQQSGLNAGIQTIGAEAFGAAQIGYNTGYQAIEPSSYGAMQIGYNGGGRRFIGSDAYGAMQIGYLAFSSSSATNLAIGAIQLHLLDTGQAALTTAGGNASLLLGAGTASNKNAIVAGDGQESHGDGSITAGGGFYGPSANISGTASVSNLITSGQWDDLLFPVNTIYAVGLTDIAYLPQSNSIEFKATCNTNFSSDNVWLVGQLSHSTKMNSAYVSPHLHFVQTSATQTNMFYLRYKRYKIGAQVPTTWTDLPLTNNVFAYSTGSVHQIANGGNIAGPFGISENFDFKIWSRGSEAVQLKFFDIHFQRDSLGSDLEYQKTF